MGKWLGKLIARLDEIIASAALILVVVITTAGVFMRYVLNDPLKWTEEATLALLVVFTFLGSSAAFRHDGHVSIDFVVERLPVSAKKAVSVIWYAVMIILLVSVFVWLGFHLALQARDKLTPLLNIPYSIIDFSVVLCGIYSLCRIASKLKKSLTRG